MKKVYLKLIVMVIFIAAVTTVFVGCVKLSEEEKEIVGIYELADVDVSGFPSISVGTYEYFTIEFRSNKKCDIKSKAGVTEYSATVDWKVNSSGEVEVITKSGFAKAVEKYKYEDGVLLGTNSTVLNGSTVEMTLKFQKIVEATEE